MLDALCADRHQLEEMVEPRIPKHPVVQIALALQHDPSREGRLFLERVADFLKGEEIDFVWSVVR